jgi:hypothetical protein
MAFNKKIATKIEPSRDAYFLKDIFSTGIVTTYGFTLTSFMIRPETFQSWT